MPPRRGQLLPLLLLSSILLFALLRPPLSPFQVTKNTQFTKTALPAVETVNERYGSSMKTMQSHADIPSTCAAFNELNPDPTARNLGVTGLFNSGTNLLSYLLIGNCELPEAFDARLRASNAQVTWGKHNPLSFRSIYTAPRSTGISPETVLPILVIKDLHTFASSLCNRRYALSFADKTPGCHLDSPVTVPNPANSEKKTYTSLIAYYNEFYTAYLDVDFPWLLVRHEDLLFRQHEVVKTVCECVGGSVEAKFHEFTKSASERGVDGREEALRKYSDERYIDGEWTDAEREAFKGIDARLNERLQYV